jgi:hypothetical protein
VSRIISGRILDMDIMFSNILEEWSGSLFPTEQDEGRVKEEAGRCRLG